MFEPQVIVGFIMVFSSLLFLWLFFPLAVLVYRTLSWGGYKRWALAGLFVASLVYYAWWKPENIWILLASIAANAGLAHLLSRVDRPAWRTFIFGVGLAVNLGALFYFKYTDFALSSLNSLAHTSFALTGIVLPIGISFFTFQQMAYLADIYNRKHDAVGDGLLEYGLFIAFFPQLVAGPIVHHGEMMPQFVAALEDPPGSDAMWGRIYEGLFLLALGLAKKVLLADNLAPLVHYAFDETVSLTMSEAWVGSLAYTLQLYFDFSGYSDMAVGCALFFGIRLPWNFDSPYQALNIQDFWRRWHITLSRWLRDYLYIPLGGNRRSTARTLLNLVLTFLLGGLWHGAAWTFVVWGALHGVALAAHRVWSRVWGRSMPRLPAWAMTFVFVNLAWIVFRAPDAPCVRKFGVALCGQSGFALGLPFRQAVETAYQAFGRVSFWHIALFGLVCLGVGSVWQKFDFLEPSNQTPSFDDVLCAGSVRWLHPFVAHTRKSI